MKFVLTIILICFCIDAQAQVSIITTIAGTGIAGFHGDDGPATSAELYGPEFMRLDKSGNIFISDCGNSRVRRIAPSTGIITTISGNGAHNYNGDNIPATAAELFVPEGICDDTEGNIYFADAGNNRVRKVDASTGTITTVAGKGPVGIGVGGATGDGGVATNAELNLPAGVSLDRLGNVYIADYCNNKIRRVDAISGTITTFAGKQGPPSYTGGFVGYSGDNGPATDAVFSGPIQVLADSIGNVFVTDLDNHVIRKINVVSNIITTIAGNGTPGYSGDNGAATNAQLNHPGGIYFDKQGNLFISEYGSGTIRKVDAATGIITTVVGTGTPGFGGDNGPATNAQLRCGDVAVDAYGTIYIADEDNNRIRMVYNPKLAVPNETPQAGIVKLYPNPAGNLLSVIYDFSSREDGMLQVVDIAGRLIMSAKLSSSVQKETVDISSLTKGIYPYKILQKNILISSGEIIKE